MSERQPDVDQREILEQKMLGVMDKSIQTEDYAFFLELAASQRFFAPVQIAQHLEEVRYNSSGNPEEQAKWRNALQMFLDGLAGMEFEADELDILNDIRNGLHYESVVNASAREDEGRREMPEDDWQTETFSIGLTQEEIIQIRKLPAVNAALQSVIKSANGKADLDDAFRNLDTIKGENAVTARRFFDWFVYIAAKSHAEKNEENGEIVDLDRAKGITELYSSSPEAKLQIRAALDKYVFEEAERLAAWDIKRANDVILDFASTPERRDAMLRRLGFM